MMKNMAPMMSTRPSTIGSSGASALSILSLGLRAWLQSSRALIHYRVLAGELVCRCTQERSRHKRYATESSQYSFELLAVWSDRSFVSLGSLHSHSSQKREGWGTRAFVVS